MLIACQICYSNNRNNKAKNVEVTYIANEGFLIKVGEKKILIDALFGDRDYGFCNIPTQETMNSILKNEGRFKDADLIAATHAHVDHFYSPFVIEHLIKNTNGKFISCKQSIDNLKKQSNVEKVVNRLVEITPNNLSLIDTTINGIGVRVYRISHGPYFEDDPKTGNKINRHQNVQNIGFLFNINGVKIFHSGDSDEEELAEYEHFRLDAENIDIAFLGRGFIWKTGCKGIELVKNYIKPKQIVIMHLHQTEFNEYNEVASKLENDFGDIKIFKNELETEKYDIK